VIVLDVGPPPCGLRPGGGPHAHGVAIMPAHLLRGVLGNERVLLDADAQHLATTAWSSLRPAA
jgi:hypothetical protein